MLKISAFFLLFLAGGLSLFAASEDMSWEQRMEFRHQYAVDPDSVRDADGDPLRAALYCRCQLDAEKCSFDEEDPLTPLRTADESGQRYSQFLLCVTRLTGVWKQAVDTVVHPAAADAGHPFTILHQFADIPECAYFLQTLYGHILPGREVDPAISSLVSLCDACVGDKIAHGWAIEKKALDSIVVLYNHYLDSLAMVAQACVDED